MPRSSTHSAPLVLALLLFLPASLLARPRHTAVSPRPTAPARRHDSRSAHHEPAQRPHHASTIRSGSLQHSGGPQIPQPARRPTSRSAAPTRTLNRISSHALQRSGSTLYPAPSRRQPGPLHRLRRHTSPNQLHVLRAQSEPTPFRYGPAQATPSDFLAAAESAAESPDQPATGVSRHLPLPAPVHASLAHLSPDTLRTTTTAIDKPELQSVERAASTPLILPTLYNARGRLIVPAPLLGSREILLHQNEMADRDGLVRVQDDDSLDVMREQHMLLPIPISEALRVDERLPANRRYSRPWTTQFLVTLGRAHYARFHTSLQVNSAVRTVDFQQRLLRTNGNAAPVDGASASPHLTGQAVDIAKHGLSVAEIAWLRGYLLPLIQAGSIDVEEEFQQSCFHISVYKRYAPAPPTRYVAASRNPTSTLATAIR